MSIYKLYILLIPPGHKKEKNMKKFLPILLICLVFLSACDQSGTKECPADSPDKASLGKNGGAEIGLNKPEKSGKVVARVNGVPIYADELNGRSVESLVTDEIIYQEGLKEGLENKYQDKLREYEMSLVVRELKDKYTQTSPPEKEITDEDLLNYYNTAKGLGYTNLRVQGIQFTDSSLGDQIIKMARDGKNFQEIAQKLSSPASQLTVKDLGFNKKMNRYFDVKEAGSLSKVVANPDGTFGVYEILDAKVTPFDSVKDSIVYIIKARRKGEAYDQYAKELAKEKGMTIEIVKE